ncbi:unnamed protein product [Cryptosporidium hominis]|uniref:Uncharacterized protein n=1 Tax=Cryptosporidium hominis TaxID=237895 RepID=A0A0S4TD98_CRYHO|nr:hypothetical protein [Cryptosporidium hominis TU502]OLQ16165.1 hypothetical protein ChTU502y2012_366g0195 [Cryptosporidium hominis]PPA63445.1 hypothetical protein ChUKH1_07890 [Cryptosporidium hominis]PPS95090.1 Uncharacterized protein GY17_00002212 [Cryptosporidium hominis]CUV04615.1 unnamed protein product [Cryptosporidium hominis]|eukprot:PPS95090.1 Uncharacterized protein GY17_00002212 [Cryptosporidium hominis]
MSKRVSLYIFIFFVLFDIFATSQYEISPNATVSRAEVLSFENSEISLKELASRLKTFLSVEQIIYLVQEIIPENLKLVAKSSEYDYFDVSESELKETYEGIIYQNLTKVPIYQLVHIPELLSNATHLRKIRNAIHSPRPIRPRKQIKGRNPSNIPGASPYFVYERVIEIYNSDSDIQTDK